MLGLSGRHMMDVRAFQCGGQPAWRGPCCKGRQRGVHARDDISRLAVVTTTAEKSTSLSDPRCADGRTEFSLCTSWTLQKEKGEDTVGVRGAFGDGDVT
jgi:hypothetical protein